MRYEVKFYNCDGAGEREILSDTKFMYGTKREVVAKIKKIKSPWGFYYRVGDRIGNGVAIIRVCSDKEYKLRTTIRKAQLELDKLMKG